RRPNRRSARRSPRPDRRGRSVAMRSSGARPRRSRAARSRVGGGLAKDPYDPLRSRRSILMLCVLAEQTLVLGPRAEMGEQGRTIAGVGRPAIPEPGPGLGIQAPGPRPRPELARAIGPLGAVARREAPVHDLVAGPIAKACTLALVLAGGPDRGH